MSIQVSSRLREVQVGNQFKLESERCPMRLKLVDENGYHVLIYGRKAEEDRDDVLPLSMGEEPCKEWV